MFKTLAISILLFALLLLAVLYIGSWLVDWRLGAFVTAVFGFSVALHWAADYLVDH